MSPPARHKNVLEADNERLMSLVQLGESAPKDIKKILLAEGYTNDEKLESIASDPFKSDLFDKTLISFHKIFSVN